VGHFENLLNVWWAGVGVHPSGSEFRLRGLGFVLQGLGASTGARTSRHSLPCRNIPALISKGV